MIAESGILYEVSIDKDQTITNHRHTVAPTNGKRFSLAELQQFVGGNIEIVPGSRPYAYCNEEGLLNGLPLNIMASAAFNQRLVGNVIQVIK